MKTIDMIRWMLATVLCALAAGAGAQQELVCGNEAQIATARAGRLQHASAQCRQDLAAGYPDCRVFVSWASVRVSGPEADALAGRLLQYAREMEAFDRQVEERIGQFSVSVSNSTVSAVQLRCSNAAVTLQGDRVVQCQMGCYATHGIPALDCWRTEGIDTMGLCLINNTVRLNNCARQCAK